MLESFLLSAADALLKAGRSKLVFDFDFEILNIPSNFCGTTIAQYYQNRRKKDKCIQKKYFDFEILNIPSNFSKYWMFHQTFIASQKKNKEWSERLKLKMYFYSWQKNICCRIFFSYLTKKIICCKIFFLQLTKKYNLLSEKYS